MEQPGGAPKVNRLKDGSFLASRYLPLVSPVHSLPTAAALPRIPFYEYSPPHRRHVDMQSAFPIPRVRPTTSALDPIPNFAPVRRRPRTSMGSFQVPTPRTPTPLALRRAARSRIGHSQPHAGPRYRIWRPRLR